jgi:murein DD-endopeptidase MepM/ murein hydrolase activator NlpD
VSALAGSFLLVPGASAHHVGTAVLEQQPDLWVAIPGMGASVGRGTYSGSGIGQALEVRAVPGSRTTLLLTIANAGNTPGSFALRGPSAGQGFSARYHANGTDVTTAVGAGDFLVSDLAPAESVTVRVTVSIREDSRKGTVATLRFTWASQIEPSRVDVARLSVKVLEPPPFSYRWPLSPAAVQHPIRGMFGDPRIAAHPHGSTTYAFHFGIDLPGAAATPVFAAASGTVFRNAQHPRRVSIRRADGRLFMYWHLRPVVHTGQLAIANRTVIGYMRRGHEHVHIAEKSGDSVINPFRPGALGPYRDGLPPSIGAIGFERRGRPLEGPLDGRVDIVAEASDTPRLRPPAPFQDAVLTPALLRWRILREDGTVARGWRTVFDVRKRLPSVPFASIFAPGTDQNRPHHPGLYRFYLAHDWKIPRSLRNGTYAVEAKATDIQGNSATSMTTFEIGASQ